MKISVALAVAGLVAAGPTAAVAADPDPNARTRPALEFALESGVRYDDNILQMSDKEIDRLATDPNSTRFRVTSPDDFISHDEFDVRFTTSLFPKRESRFSTGVEVFRFRTNSIKNWNEYHAAWSQELSASRRHLFQFRLAADWISDYYLRELTDDDASFNAGHRIRRSATYDQSGITAILSKEFVENRLTGRVGWEGTRRNYVHFFDERDGHRTESWVEVQVKPIRRARLDAAAAATTGRYAAKGDLASSPIADDDISYDLDGARFRVSWAWGEQKRGRVEATAEFERRDFTTTNMFDLTHFGREDHRRERGVQLSQRIARSVEILAEWQRISNNATFSTAATPQDEITDFTDSRYTVGVRVRFDAF